MEWTLIGRGMLARIYELDHAVAFAAGDRIAQLVVQQVAHARFELVDELPPSVRGISGHGSTGGILGR